MHHPLGQYAGRIVKLKSDFLLGTYVNPLADLSVPVPDIAEVETIVSQAVGGTAVERA